MCVWGGGGNGVPLDQRGRGRGPQRAEKIDHNVHDATVGRIQTLRVTSFSFAAIFHGGSSSETKFPII